MNKVWAVVRREFLERVRTKAFILGTFLFPVFIVGISVLPALLITGESGTKRVALVDGASGGFGTKVEEAMAAARIGDGPEAEPRYRVERFTVSGEALEATRDSLIGRTALGREADGFDGVLVVDDAGLLSGRLQYFGDDAASPRATGELQSVVRPIVTRERLEREGVDPTTVMRAIGPVSLVTQKVTNGKLTGQSGEATFILAYAMGFILYMALLLYGVQVMNSIVEEKSNRIMEILASSLSPFQMLLGKVVGVGAVALLQIGIWAGTAYAFTTYRTEILGLFGVDPSAASGLAGVIPAIPGPLLTVFLLFFVLGFLLYSAMYAAVGAMCNTVQETQQAQFPVMFLIILGLMTMFALLNDPNSSMAQTLSYVPFWTPFVIPVRYSMSPVPLPQLAASVAITVLGMLAITWLAGRIYRIGILSYGKRASMRDIVRWVRAG